MKQLQSIFDLSSFGEMMRSAESKGSEDLGEQCERCELHPLECECDET
jgi:hypothetical protein